MSNIASTKRRKGRRRNRQKGKGLTKKQKAQVENMVKQPSEKKFADYEFSLAGITSLQAIADITQVDQGTDGDQNIGTQIELESVQYNLLFTKADTTNWIRFVLFQWIPDSANDVPAWGQVMHFPTAGGNPISQMDRMSPYLLGKGNSSIFKILEDHQFTLDDNNPTHQIKGFINKGFRKNLGMRDSIPSQGENHIFYILISDSGAINHPTVDGYFRIRFYDS